MRIVAVTRVFNEEDIIEAMVRHHAALVDHHILLDNGSEDRTLEILGALAAEGIPLTVIQNETVVYSEVQFNTYLYNFAAARQLADWVLFLDADEFIDTRAIGNFRDFLASMPAAQPCVGVDMINYDAPSAATDGNLNPAERFSRRLAAPIGVWKVFVRGGFAEGRVVVDAGNHNISLDGTTVDPPQQRDVVLAHYPNRSPFHWAYKAFTGRLRVLAAGQAELRQGRSFHYTETVERLKRDPVDWLRGALHHAGQQMTAANLVDDPIAYLGGPLLYTQPLDPMQRAAGLMVATAEKMAEWMGALRDASPEAQALVDAWASDMRILFETQADATHGRAEHGTIVTQAWRSAAQRSFLPLLGAGWSKPEDWGGVWGVGAEHELRLGYVGGLDADREITMDVQASLPGSRERQVVDVAALGETLASWEFTHDHNRAMRTLLLPGRLIAQAAPMLSLLFRPHFVAAPSELSPGNKDTRKLGMGLRGLRQRLV